LRIEILPHWMPYDWRLSNVVSTRRLWASAVPALKRWRAQTDNPDAKLVCHSMGGLADEHLPVASHFRASLTFWRVLP
jgi:hypothetical protein